MVGFQAITAVPVATAFDEGFGALDVLLHQQLVVEKDSGADDGENEIDAGAEDSSLLKDGLVGRDCFIL